MLEPPMVIIEYVPYGDLLGYLRKSRGLNDTYYKDPDVKPKTNLTSQQLMKFAWQVADGMNYLSSKKVTKVIVVNYLYLSLKLVRIYNFVMCLWRCLCHCLSAFLFLRLFIAIWPPETSWLARERNAK